MKPFQIVRIAGLALFASAAAQAAVISNGLIGEYTFESSNAVDTSTSTSGIGNGSAVGTPAYGSAAGRSGTVLNITPGNYVAFAQNPVMPVAAQARTFSFWLQVTTTSGNAGPLRFGGPEAGDRDFSLEIRDENTLGLNLWGQDVNFDVADLGSWHNISYTYDGISAIVYLDGVLAGSRGSVGDPLTLNTRDTLGMSFGGPRLGSTNDAGGVYSIDDVLIYNRALSPSEITTLATVPEPSVILLGGLSLAGFLIRRRA